MHSDGVWQTLNMSLAPGQRITVTISDIAFGGEGVGRFEDVVVFVPFVACGEVVEAEIFEVHKRFARARLVQVVQPAADRVTPPCPYFGTCGGCQYQHLSYDTQLRVKRKQIADLFQRLGGFQPEIVSSVIPCPQPYGYRNRIMIRSQWDKTQQRLNIGFIRADSRLVVDIEECKIAEPALNVQIKQVRREPPPRGGIKVVLRIPPDGWQVPPDSFFQNNFFLLPELVKVARDCIQQSGVRYLVDVYCGVGFFSLELSDLVESFVGVEWDRLAIQAARQSASARAVTNGEFLAGAAEEALPGLLARFEPSCTAVLLDPPRKGCAGDLLQILRDVRPGQIIYVSCHPATMARDLNILCGDGVFELARVVPLDMFPQTSHVECVAELRRGAAPARN